RLRRGESTREPWRRCARRPDRPQTVARTRLAACAAGRAARRTRAELVADRRRERPSGREPGARLVDDGRDEDRPSRPGAARACSQAGLANNLNDALAWGLVPLYLAAHGASGTRIGVIAAVYPGLWGVLQLATGWLSDLVGRKPLIVLGMLVQSGALALLVAGGGAFAPSLAAAALLGAGTALVYPTLIAAVSAVVQPRHRPTAVGVYRFLPH